MCGIAGIISKEPIKASQLKRMADIQKHRGPDDEGYALFTGSKGQFFKGDDTVGELQTLPHISNAESSGNTGFAHRRLSIVDLSEKGHQPLHREDWQLTICYNGEIYNYQELRSELEAAGFQFHSTCDTEVLLAAWKKWGADCAKRLVGMWAFAVYDHASQQVWLSRDRFGIKPLYLLQKENTLGFASEIKALLLLNQNNSLNEKATLEYLSFGASANPNQTLFSNITELPPGEQLMIDTNSLQTKASRYYHLEEAVGNTTVRPDNYAEQYHELLDESVQLHLQADVNVGSCLSGGNDSSYLVALAAQKTSSPFHTFTASYPNNPVDESTYAKAVAARYDNVEDHYCQPTPEQYLKQIDQLIWHQDLPINSTSAFAQWSVMELAGQHQIKVLLDGQGADESLGGYYNFAGIFLLEKMLRLQFGAYAKNKKLLEENFNPNMGSATKRAGYYLLPQFLQKSLRKKERLGQNLIQPNYAGQLQQMNVPERGGKSFTELSLNSIRFSLRQLLRYEDRNSMAFSIESRVPFLHHKLVEFSIALPATEKIKNGWTKHVMRQASDSLLPKEVVWRKDKLGFVTPQQEWKQQLGPVIKDYILQAHVPAVLNKQYITELCQTELNHPSKISEFFKVFAFMKWAEIVKVK